MPGAERRIVDIPVTPSSRCTSLGAANAEDVQSAVTRAMDLKRNMVADGRGRIKRGVGCVGGNERTPWGREGGHKEKTQPQPPSLYTSTPRHSPPAVLPVALASSECGQLPFWVGTYPFSEVEIARRQPH